MFKLDEINVFAICLHRKPPAPKCIQSWKRVFPQLKIFDAVDGSTIDVERSNRVHVLGKMYLNGANAVANDSIFALPSRGAVGCAMSHIALLKLCVDANKPIIVIEQDVFSLLYAKKYFRQ